MSPILRLQFDRKDSKEWKGGMWKKGRLHFSMLSLSWYDPYNGNRRGKCVREELSGN